jgi:hypothetical protein
MDRVAIAGDDLPLERALNKEGAAQIEYFNSSPDTREGLVKFAQKRSRFHD